jgi:hypothetical protein
MAGADEGTSIYDDVRRNPNPQNDPHAKDEKPRVVETQLSLEQALDSLDQSVRSLAEKIAPILGPDYAEDSSEAEAPAPEMSPMAAWIDREVSFVRNLRRRVEEFERRVEL